MYTLRDIVNVMLFKFKKDILYYLLGISFWILLIFDLLFYYCLLSVLLMIF